MSSPEGSGRVSFIGRLRTRLALIVAAALAPAGVLALSQAVEGLELAEARSYAALEAAALGAADGERATLAGMRQTMRLASVTVDAGPNCEPFLTALVEGNAWADGAALYDAQGRLICGAEAPDDISDRPVWRRFVETGDYSLSTVAGAGEGAPMLALRAATGDQGADGIVEEGRALGVVIDTAFLRLFVNESDGGRKFALLGIEGEALLPPGVAGEAWLPADRGDLQVFGDRGFELTAADGDLWRYHVSVLEGEQLWAVTGAPKRRLADILISDEMLALAAPIVLWIIAVAVAYFAIDQLVTRHVAVLRGAAVRIGAGDLDAPIASLADAPEEIRRLGQAVKAMRDNIADREASLQETLDVQRRLLLEVHHRVKNNLQMISSLMNLESRRTADAAGRAQLTDLQNRIHSLAMVHQNLYAAERLEEVALDHLAHDIAGFLEESLAPPDERNDISFDLAPITASTVLATPIALFLSEALGNAFKHGDAPRRISISLTGEGDGFVLSVSNRASANAACDDPSDAARRSGGLGLRLMSGFAKQIGGVFSAELKHGRFVVSVSGRLQPSEHLFSVRSRPAD